jgi:MFS transporter, MHS family, proline/betaine transporter
MDKRALIMVGSGNILEWFDFALFIYLAPLIGKYFFPAHSLAYSTTLTYGVFAAGFICRPVGGILFGHLGDHIGRSKTLMLTILVISISTILLGLLPGYTQIGWLAAVLFVGLRCIHGLSVGGEYTGAVIYLGESAPAQKKGLVTSFAMVGANLGFFLATLVTLLLSRFSSPFLTHWGWRLAFIFSGGLGGIILYNRFRLQESNAFLYLKNHKKIIAKPFFAVLRYAPKILLQILGLTCMGAPFYYMFFGYMPNYLAQHTGVPLFKSLGIQSILLLLMLILLPIAGICGDRFGRKKVLLFTALGMVLLVLPCLNLMQQSSTVFIFAGLGLATLLSSLEQGNNLVTFVENCPSNIRYTSISFGYNTGNAVFGGTAPLIFSLLTKQFSLTVAGYYLIAMTVISLFTIMSFRSRSDAVIEAVDSVKTIGEKNV